MSRIISLDKKEKITFVDINLSDIKIDEKGLKCVFKAPDRAKLFCDVVDLISPLLDESINCIDSDNTSMLKINDKLIRIEFEDKTYNPKGISCILNSEDIKLEIETFINSIDNEVRTDEKILKSNLINRDKIRVINLKNI